MEKIRSLDVLVPIYNEEKCLEEFSWRLFASLGELGIPFYVLFVDDGSSDNSKALIKEICASMIAMLELEQADMVYGKRKLRLGESWLKKSCVNLFYRLFDRFSRFPFPRDTGDFRVMRRNIVVVLQRMDESNRFMLFALSFFALYLSSTIQGHGVGVINVGFFWLSGAATYQIGPGLYFIAMASFIWMARGRRPRLNLLCGTLSLALAMGSNETLMALCLGSVCCLIWIYRKQFRLGFMVVFVVAITCCLLVLMAPGNGVRLSSSEGQQLFSALGICVEKLVGTYFYFFINPLLWLFVLFFRDLIDAFTIAVKALIPLRLFNLGLVLLIFCLYFLVAWALDSGAPDRLLSFIGFISLLCAIFFIRLLLQKVLHLVSLNKILLSCGLLTVFSFPYLYEPLYIAAITAVQGPAFHHAHKERDTYVQQQAASGTASVGVEPITRNPLLLFRDLEIPDHAVSYAHYYGVKKVFIVEKPSVP